MRYLLPCYVPLLRPHGQHHTKPRAAADHLLVGFGSFFERIAFDHRTDSRERAELHGVLGIGGGSRSPSPDGLAASNHLNWCHRDRISPGAYHDKLAVAGKPID